MKNQEALAYQEKIEKLFLQWKERSGMVEYRENGQSKQLCIDHKNHVFIKDGVVCPERWFSQEIRPLFLLKEAHGGTKDWDLIADQLCGNDKIDKIWKRISLWAKGMVSTTKQDMASFAEEDAQIANYGNDYLKQIAVINVKKSGGKPASDMNTIRAYAAFDKENLYNQLVESAPTVIICGYTASALEIITDQKFRNPRNDNLFYHLNLNGHDVLVLDYWHPANHYPEIMNYYGLMGIYQKALQEK